MRAPRRRLNPFLLRRVEQSGKKLTALTAHGGFRHYADFFNALREDKIRVTPLMQTRLERVADAVGFPKDEIFLDGPSR